jgi:hypothetical protein
MLSLLVLLDLAPVVVAGKPVRLLPAPKPVPLWKDLKADHGDWGATSARRMALAGPSQPIYRLRALWGSP